MASLAALSLEDDSSDGEAPLLIDPTQTTQNTPVPVHGLLRFFGRGQDDNIETDTRERGWITHSRRRERIRRHARPRNVVGGRLRARCRRSNCRIAERVCVLLDEGRTRVGFGGARPESTTFGRYCCRIVGVADPGPVAAGLWLDDALESPVVLDGVVCVVDGVSGLGLLESSGAGAFEAKRAVATADRILLSKADLCDVSSLEEAVRSLNPAADVRRSIQGAGDFGIDGFLIRGGTAGPPIGPGFGLGDAS